MCFKTSVNKVREQGHKWEYFMANNIFLLATVSGVQGWINGDSHKTYILWPCDLIRMTEYFLCQESADNGKYLNNGNML